MTPAWSGRRHSCISHGPRGRARESSGLDLHVPPPAATPAEERVHIAADLAADDGGQDGTNPGLHRGADLAADIAETGRGHGSAPAPSDEVVLLAPRIVGDGLHLEPLLHLGGREAFLLGRGQYGFALPFRVGLTLPTSLCHCT